MTLLSFYLFISYLVCIKTLAYMLWGHEKAGLSLSLSLLWTSLVAQMVENGLAIQETGFDPWSERSPGEENSSYPLQCSCLENSMDRGT